MLISCCNTSIAVPAAACPGVGGMTLRTLSPAEDVAAGAAPVGGMSVELTADAACAMLVSAALGDAASLPLLVLFLLPWCGAAD